MPTSPSLFTTIVLMKALARRWISSILRCCSGGVENRKQMETARREDGPDKYPDEEDERAWTRCSNALMPCGDEVPRV